MRPISGGHVIINGISRYKQFHIVVRVEIKSDGDGERCYEISGQIRRVKDETDSVRNWLLCKEFETEQAAYAYALQEARAWIDEHAGD